MERILITGARGRIGIVLVPALEAAGYTVYGLDIKPPREKNDLTVDITKKRALANAFQSIKPVDYVVHLAGNPDENASWEEINGPNFTGITRVYECARDFGVRRVVFASSTHVIGRYPGYPQGPIEGGRILTETDPYRSDGYYGDSKIYGEGLAGRFFKDHGLSSICIRVGAFRPEPLQEGDIYRKLTISLRDLAQMVKLALKVNVRFGIYFATSNIRDGYLDLSNAKKDLGYSPEDTF